MGSVIIEEKYKFIQPSSCRLWCRIGSLFIPDFVQSQYGLSELSFSGLEKLKQLTASGKAVILAPNHCRPCDPMVVVYGANTIGLQLYTMASWHLFKQNWINRVLLPRFGVFSIYREGMDRDALSFSSKVLESGERPLLIFPEGVINRTNDRIGDFLDGVGLIARMGAKKRKDGEVSILPVAIRYKFEGNTAGLNKDIHPVLSELERRLTWKPKHDSDLRARVAKLALALLGLKEFEYLGTTTSGGVDLRVNNLVNHLLAKHESRWLKQPQQGNAKTTKTRVKALRNALVPVLLADNTTDAEKADVWATLDDIYVAQQISYYSSDYFANDASITQLLEVVEKLEEDLLALSRHITQFRQKLLYLTLWWCGQTQKGSTWQKQGLVLSRN